jgi:probable HAF family extracellular repeat protein
MKHRTVTYITVMTVLVALAIPTVAQDRKARSDKREHQHYRLIDIGTFGGPLSYFNSLSLSDRFGFSGAAYTFAQVLNPRGILVGGADTPMPDPFPNSCFTPFCFASRAFQWQNGIQTDLGALPAGANSLALWINSNGLIVGVSQNGSIDPLSGFPELRAVYWKNGQIADLGTLGGNVSLAGAVNDRDQIVGVATNEKHDPFSFAYGFSNGTQTRAVLWDHGVPQDLGTLGGADAAPTLVNQRGQVAGFSYTNSTPNLDDGTVYRHLIHFSGIRKQA